jgi:anti-anti-sigma regulatory factor
MKTLRHVRNRGRTAVREGTEAAEAPLSAGWLPAVAADHGVRVLLPRGEVSGDGYELIERAAALPLRQGGPRVVLDLTHVEHLDYRGLPSFGRIVARLRAEGGDLRLAGASSYLRTILRFVGLEGELRFFADADEAVASFAPARATASAGR